MSYIAYCLMILVDYIQMKGWAGYVACVERMRYRLAHNLFVEERQGKRLLGRLQLRRDDNIKIVRDGVNCVHPTRDGNSPGHAVSSVMYVRVTQKAESFLSDRL
jgi:hypothetical protein